MHTKLEYFRVLKRATITKSLLYVNKHFNTNNIWKFLRLIQGKHYGTIIP